MLWASLSLPTLALDAALRGRESPDRPFVLVAGSAHRQRLVAVDPLARAAGLRPGQRLAEARAVCGNLLAVGHDPAATRAALALVAAWAYQHSPQVCLDPPRAVTLEVGRSLRLFGSWPRLQQRLREGLLQLGFHHRIALAPTARAARVLANFEDGTAVTESAALPRALARVPVARAGLPMEAAEALTGMGLRNLGAVLALPRAGLQRRFGKELVEALALLLGECPAQLTPWRPPDRFDADVDFGCEVRHTDGLQFPLRRLLADLAAFLSARDGGVQRFAIRFVHADTPPTELAIGLLAPEREASALFEVARLHLERLRLPAPVLELSLHADALPPFVPEATDLLDARSANALPWPQLVERLRARLGEDSVHGIAADPDPRPERAWVRDDATKGMASPRPVGKTLEQRRKEIAGRRGTGRGVCTPVHEPPGNRRHASQREERIIQGLPRPTWLLHRPIPLRGPAPVVLAGPERIETGWWDDDEVRRDYYVLELAGGQRAWAFCAPGERGPFMLHGWFA